MSREVPAVVGILVMCVAIAAAGTDMGRTCFRDIERVDPTEPLAVTLRPLKVRRVRLETVTPSDDSHYVTVKFDILNEGETSVSNIVFEVMLIDTRPDAGPRIVAGPFTFRSKSALDAENTMELEVRVRDLTPSCRCRPFVRIASASIPSPRQDTRGRRSLSEARVFEHRAADGQWPCNAGTKKHQPRDIALAKERWVDYEQLNTRAK